MSRIDNLFARLQSEDKAAFIGYIMGGDPDFEKSMKLMQSMPEAGVDIIELGFPFTDPAADGPVIEDAGLRALKAKTSLRTVLQMAADFRRDNDDTPIILMGYTNPVHAMGYDNFAKSAYEAGADGAIIVDLPPEEDTELRLAFGQYNLALIRLATPTTDDERLKIVANNAKGFIYYVSVAGITGAGIGENNAVSQAVAKIKSVSSLPVVVGFGIKTQKQAKAIANYADGVVVGSAIVKSFHEQGLSKTLSLIKSLAGAVHS